MTPTLVDSVAARALLFPTAAVTVTTPYTHQSQTTKIIALNSTALIPVPNPAAVQRGTVLVRHPKQVGWARGTDTPATEAAGAAGSEKAAGCQEASLLLLQVW